MGGRAETEEGRGACGREREREEREGAGGSGRKGLGNILVREHILVREYILVRERGSRREREEGRDLGHDGFNEFHSGLEEGPLGVHFLELGEVPGIDLGLERKPDAKPHRQVHARLRPREHPRDSVKRDLLSVSKRPCSSGKRDLGPREHPRDSTQRFDAALGPTFGGTGPNIEALELLLGGDGAEILDEVGRLIHHFLVRRARVFRHALHHLCDNKKTILSK
jgi:hypothetical protein